MSFRLSPALAEFAEGRWPDERVEPRGLDSRDMDRRQRHSRQPYLREEDLRDPDRRDLDRRVADPPPLEPPLHPSEIERLEREHQDPAIRRRKPGFVRVAIVFCAGAATALAWQAWGNKARGAAASLSPALGWLAPPPAPVPAGKGIGVAPEQINALTRSLATARQSLDRLKDDIARLQAATAADSPAVRASSSTPVSLPPPAAFSQRRK